MKAQRLLPAILNLALLALLAAGCASRDVNPAMARSDRGYVDLYTVPKSDVWWLVDVYDARDKTYKEFTAQFKTPEQSIFRVEAKPGRHKALISFVNRPVEAPAEGEVEVVAGMITPVRVTIEKGDASYVRTVDDRVRSGFSTAGRNSVVDSVEERVVITSKALPPIPYAPKAQMDYWK
jgi:hypothetical protein